MFVKKILRLGKGILRFIKVIIDNLKKSIMSIIFSGGDSFKEGEV